MRTPSRRRVGVNDGEGSEEEDFEAQPVRKPSIRFHFMDWMRVALVLAVVYGHTAVSGLQTGGGYDQPWMIDARTLWYDKTYREYVQSPTTDKQFKDWDFKWADQSRHPAGPSPYSGRWISILRQWALPALFWISGASAACSYRGGMPRGLDKLAFVSILGMASNAVLWFTSPQNPKCILDSVDQECVGKGSLFDFNIAGRAGWWFAILFQMWYVVVLIVCLLISWPLFSVVQGSGKFGALAAHFVVTMGVISLLVCAPVGEQVPQPFLKMLELAGLEVIFMACLAADAPLIGRGKLDWLPVRAVHYLMAVVLLMQFAIVSYSDEGMHHLGPSYFAYIVVGFLRFFHLGFVMLHAQTGPEGDRVQPICSNWWPLNICVLLFFMPSTNWDLAGMITYPYYPNWVDRFDYIGGAVMIIFFIDRVSRGVNAMPVPSLLNYASLLIYLFHPWFVTALLAVGFRSVCNIWFASVALGLSITGVLMQSCALCSRRREEVEGPSDTSDPEESSVFDARSPESSPSSSMLPQRSP